ncbi:MAG: amidohydrolase family protein [Puniceicoccales bacterium]
MVIDAHNHIGIEWINYLLGDHPYAQSLEDLFIKARSTPVTHWVAFPFVSYAREFPALTPDAGDIFSEVPYALANLRLLEEVQRDAEEKPRAVLPFVMVDPERDVHKQVKALRKMSESHSIFGIKVQSTIIQSRIARLMDESKALVDLAAEWDVPMLIHSSIHPEDAWSQCSDILAVAESRPEVRFVLAHSCRFHRPSLDRIAELSNAWFDCSAHRIHCQLAVGDSLAVARTEDRFVSDYRNPAEVLRDLYESYPNKLIWGTDSPYYSWRSSRGELPESFLSSYEGEWDCVEALPVAGRKAVTSGNTLAWLGIEECDV